MGPNCLATRSKAASTWFLLETSVAQVRTLRPLKESSSCLAVEPRTSRRRPTMAICVDPASANARAIPAPIPPP